MTEDDAKTKWCPFARTLDWASDAARSGDEPTLVAASVNREPGEYDRDGNETVIIQGRHRCIASACMAWRWIHRPVKAEPSREVVDDRGPGGNPQFMPRVIPAVEGVEGRGYCGLAGAPR